MGERLCLGCGKPYKPSNPRQRYCGPKCRRNAQKGRYSALAMALRIWFKIPESLALDILDRYGMRTAQKLIPKAYRMEVLYGGYLVR